MFISRIGLLLTNFVLNVGIWWRNEQKKFRRIFLMSSRKSCSKMFIHTTSIIDKIIYTRELKARCFLLLFWGWHFGAWNSIKNIPQTFQVMSFSSQSTHTHLERKKIQLRCFANFTNNFSCFNLHAWKTFGKFTTRMFFFSSSNFNY